MGMIEESISAILKLNIKNIKYFILFILILGIFSPYIDSFIVKPLQIQSELTVLKQLNEISTLNLTLDIEQQLFLDLQEKSKLLLSTNNYTFNIYDKYRDDPWKFYSSISIWVLVFGALLFQKMSFIKKLPSLIAVIMISIIIGTVGLLLPTIINPWFNYIGFPIVQIILLFSLLENRIKL